MLSFGPCDSPVWRRRVTLWSVFYRQGTLPSQEIKSHTACTGRHFVWKHLPLFPTMWAPLFCLRVYVTCHPAAVSAPLWWGDGFFAPTGGVCAWQLPLSIARRDPSHGKWCLILTLSSLGLFSVSCSELGCFVSSVGLMHRGSAERRSDFHSRCWAIDATCWVIGCQWGDCTQHARLLVPAVLFFPVAPSDPFSLSSVNVRWVGPND